MYKCFDMSKLYFIEEDTDFQAWAVACSPSKPITQAFEEVIIDKAFYNTFANRFFLITVYSTDGKFPEFEDFRKEHPEHDENTAYQLFSKRFGAVALEIECESMVALAPKMYCPFNAAWKKGAIIQVKPRAKGVIIKQNPLAYQNFLDIFNKQNTQKGHNTNLQLHQCVMSKITMQKNILTATHTKYQESNDWSTCMPLHKHVEEDESVKPNEVLPLSVSNQSEVSLGMGSVDIVPMSPCLLPQADSESC
jgi:hypothetical protein